MIRISLLFAFTCATSCISTAYAGDWSTSQQLPFFSSQQPKQNWFGSYIGVTGGFVTDEKSYMSSFQMFSSNFQTLPRTTFSGSQFKNALPSVNSQGPKFNSFSTGGQVGYNHKLNERLMIGVEADIQRNKGF